MLQLAVEQWVKLQQAAGFEEYAKETSRLYQKSGYRTCLKRYATDAEKWEDFYEAATHYSLLGEKNAALDNLERAAAAGRNVDFLRLDPALDNIRSDPRYTALLRRLGLPQ